MVTLELGNSYSRLIGLTAAQEKTLKDELSYEVSPGSAFFSGGHRPRKKCLLDKRGNFPTGLLDRVGMVLDWQFLLNDHRIVPNKTLIVNSMQRTPYPSQEQATERAALTTRGIISMPTGSGKSQVIAMITARLQVRTLIVVPSLEIKEQLKASLEEVFGQTKNIVVENIGSPNLFNDGDFGCLIIDEGHHVAAATYQKLNKQMWNGIFYRFFMTATPFRNNDNEALLFEAIAGDLIYELTYQDAVKYKYIVPVESYYYEVPRQETDAYTWAQVYSELVVNNQIRNLMIADILLRLKGNFTLCLVKEVKHGKILAELTGLPFVHGQDEESRKFIQAFNKGEIKGLIGTEGVIGEGVDTKPCEFVVIAGLGKAKSAFMQKCGRAVRTYPGKESAKIIIFRDKSHKFTLRHYNSQAKILKSEYNSVPQKLGL